jgi:hypothetical protein
MTNFFHLQLMMRFGASADIVCDPPACQATAHFSNKSLHTLQRAAATVNNKCVLQ